MAPWGRILSLVGSLWRFEFVEGHGDGLVERHVFALGPCGGEEVFVECRANGRNGLVVVLAVAWREWADDGLAKGFGRAEKPGGRFHAPQPDTEAGRFLETPCQKHLLAQLGGHCQTVLEKQASLCMIALPGSHCSQVAQLIGFQAAVADGAIEAERKISTV